VTKLQVSSFEFTVPDIHYSNLKTLAIDHDNNLLVSDLMFQFHKINQRGSVIYSVDLRSLFDPCIVAVDGIITVDTANNVYLSLACYNVVFYANGTFATSLHSIPDGTGNGTIEFALGGGGSLGGLCVDQNNFTYIGSRRGRLFNVDPLFSSVLYSSSSSSSSTGNSEFGFSSSSSFPSAVSSSAAVSTYSSSSVSSSSPTLSSSSFSTSLELPSSFSSSDVPMISSSSLVISSSSSDSTFSSSTSNSGSSSVGSFSSSIDSSISSSSGISLSSSSSSSSINGTNTLPDKDALNLTLVIVIVVISSVFVVVIMILAVWYFRKRRLSNKNNYVNLNASNDIEMNGSFLNATSHI
jgi:hypothetical protein